MAIFFLCLCVFVQERASLSSEQVLGSTSLCQPMPSPHCYETCGSFLDTFRFEEENKYDFEILIFAENKRPVLYLFLTRKVSTVIFIKGG